MDESYSHCFVNCPYVKICSEDYGNGMQMDLFGDDFRAVEGSHFCRLSWQQFANDCTCFQKEINRKNFNPI